VPEVLLAIAQRQTLMRPPHDIADITARAILDDQSGLDLHLRIARTRALLSELLEDVALGSAAHLPSVTREPI